MILKIKKHFKKIILILIILLLLGFGFYQYQQSGQKPTEYVTAKVLRSDLTQTVSATGTIKPLTEVQLNFTTARKITVINVEKGSRIKQDEVLAKQDDVSLSIAVQQAQANLDSAIAILNKLKAPVTAEDLTVTQKKVDSAQTAYDNAVKNLETLRKKTTEEVGTYEESVNSAQTTLADQQINLTDIKNKYAQNIKNLEQADIVLMNNDLFSLNTSLDTINKSLTNNNTFSTQQASGNVSQSNNSYLLSALQKTTDASVLVDQAKQRVVDLESGAETDVNSGLSLFIKTFDSIKQALSLTYSALQNTVATNNYSQTAIDANKTDLISKQTTVETNISALQTAQTNLIDANLNYNNQKNTAQAAVNTAEDNLKKAKANLTAAEANRDLQLSNAEAEIDSSLAALKLTQSELAFKKAPPRQVDLASQEAQIDQYRAALALAEDTLKNASLVSPINGVVTAVNYEVGEQNSLAEPVVVLMTENSYVIEVDVSESDIVKVKNNNEVKVTLDAFGEDLVLNAKVIFIDPAQTIISDVVYYKVKIMLEELSDELLAKIKPGMTSNIDIMTNRKDQVLIIPLRAIQEKNGGKYVRVLENNNQQQTIKELKVKTGIDGDDGMVEITDGLTEGQEVITFEKNGTK